jgi:hypothetical protein
LGEKIRSTAWVSQAMTQRYTNAGCPSQIPCYKRKISLLAAQATAVGLKPAFCQHFSTSQWEWLQSDLGCPINWLWKKNPQRSSGKIVGNGGSWNIYVNPCMGMNMFWGYWKTWLGMSMSGLQRGSQQWSHRVQAVACGRQPAETGRKPAKKTQVAPSTPISMCTLCQTGRMLFWETQVP